MAALRTELVKRRHAYTSEDVPWEILPGKSGVAISRCIHGKGLHGTSAHVAAERRQNRFLRLAAILAIVWLVLFLA